MHRFASTSSSNNTSNPLSFHVADTTGSHELAAPFAQHQQEQQCPNTFSDSGLPPLMQGGYPVLAAGSEDWAFQGVDMAFFENIMRNVGGDV
jgi:hypothetical protein